MTAEIIIAALCVIAALAFVCGEQYGRAHERRVRERMRDRARERKIEEIRDDMRSTIRDLAWHGREEASS